MTSDFELITSTYYQCGAKCLSTFPSSGRRDAGLLQWETGNVKSVYYLWQILKPNIINITDIYKYFM